MLYKQFVVSMQQNKYDKIPIKRFGDIMTQPFVPHWEPNPQRKWIGIKLKYPFGFQNGIHKGNILFNCNENQAMFIPVNDCDLSNQITNSSSKPSPSDFFHLLYNKYVKDKLSIIPDPLLTVVPVKHGKPHHRHREWFGDGNQKITKQLCALPIFLFQCLEKKQIKKFSTMDNSHKEYFQCNNSPYCGNQNVRSSSLCLNHTMKIWLSTGLDRKEIEDFIKYCNLKERKKFTTSTKMKNDIDKELLNYGQVIQRYETIIKYLKRSYKTQEDCDILMRNGINCSEYKSMDEEKENVTTDLGMYIYIAFFSYKSYIK